MEGYVPDSIVAELKEHFGGRLDYRGAGTSMGIFCFIDGVKVDIVKYPFATIEEIVVEEGIRFYADQDIAAMKAQAILGRGKKKDFWDIAELLDHYSVDQVVDWHRRKFPDQMLAISIPYALTYFVDADQSEEPVSLKGQTWESVKDAIKKKVNEYLC